jgi:hypothetical protein
MLCRFEVLTAAVMKILLRCNGEFHLDTRRYFLEDRNLLKPTFSAELEILGEREGNGLNNGSNP